MENPFLKIWMKVFFLTWVFFVLINFFWYLINADSSNSWWWSNLENFAKKDDAIIAHVWVALSTNIWTRFKEMNELPITLYNEVMDAWYIMANKNKASEELINNHMIVLREYLNVLQTDIRHFLNQANDRWFALDSYTAQLEFRHSNANENLRNLIRQRDELRRIYDNAESRIDNIRKELSTNFWWFKSKETIENIDEYLELREESTYARTYIIFINKFIDYYTALNNYNKTLLNTLTLNREALIKNANVIIPQAWSSMLRDLELIINE